MMRTFWFDVDGVLLNLERVIRLRMYEHLGRPMPDDTPVSSSSFEESFGIPDAVLGMPTDPPNELWRAIWQSWCQPYPWAVDVVRAAKDAGFRTASISWRVGMSKRASRRDLLRAGIPLDDIVYTDSASDKPKHFAAGDVYIDDHPKHAANAAHARPDVRVLLLDQPWNAYCADLGGYTRTTPLGLLERMNEL